MELSYTEFEDRTMKLRGKDASLGDDFYPVATVGAMSYMIHVNYSYNTLKQAHILVGRYSQIAHNVTIDIAQSHSLEGVSAYPFDQVMHVAPVFLNRAPYNRQQLMIGNDVWIDAGVRIAKAVRIGTGAIIESGAVVTEDVPPYTVVGGNPAKVLRYRFDKETREKLLLQQWWNWDKETVSSRWEDMLDVDGFLEKYAPEAPEETDGSKKLAARLKRLRQKGVRTSCFVVDFDTDLPLWEEVVRQFRYCGEENSFLTLIVPIGLEEHPSMEALGEKLKPLKGKAAVLLGTSGCVPGILKETDCFLTSREAVSTACADYMDVYGGEVASALEYYISF